MSDNTKDTPRKLSETIPLMTQIMRFKTDLESIGFNESGVFYKEIMDAMDIAGEAHRGQNRKCGKVPYIVHPIRVACRLIEFYRSTDWVPNPNLIKAALLHDVVEDTKFSLYDIKNLVNDEVAGLVYWLTDMKVQGNRAFRKEMSIIRLTRAPLSAKILKLMDIADNIEDSDGLGDFKKQFLEEKRLILSAIYESIVDIDMKTGNREIAEAAMHFNSAKKAKITGMLRDLGDS